MNSIVEDVRSITLECRDGLKKNESIIEYFRNNILDPIAGKWVLYVEDYKFQRRVHLNDFIGIEKIDLPKENVVKFILRDGSWICLRPSGTEPRLNIYGGAKGSTLEESKENLTKMITWIEEKIQVIN